MELLIKMTTDMMGPMGPLIVLGAVILFFVLLLVAVMSGRRPDPLEKLNADRKSGNKAKNKEAKLRQAGRNEKLDRYATFLEPQNAEELSAVKLKLMQAGYRGNDAVRYFHFAQFALGIGFLGLGLAYYLLVAKTDTSTAKDMLLWVVGPGGAGYMLPKYWVTRRVESRKEQIQDGFPDALDMMLVCIEAGQSLDQSIIRVGNELRASFPALAEEFQTVSLEMKAGKDKTNVLNDMSERAGVQDVSSFVTVLIQSQTFGTSISDALRVYAAEMRDKRVMRAEEKANKLPTKMTLTTMMFTVPPLLIILVGPSAVGISELGNLNK